MAEPVQIRRYPNRRFYSRDDSRYVSLEDIEGMVRGGRRVEIRDSQTDEDLTRVVLTRVLIERSPEKMALFPVELLHFILRSNDVMADFLRDYFRHALTYLEFLQRHSASVPMHWVQAWLESLGRPALRGPGRPEPPLVPPAANGDQAASREPTPANAAAATADQGEGEQGPGGERERDSGENARLRHHIQQLEERIRRLESGEDRNLDPNNGPPAAPGAPT